jgi:peptidoglycan lytic transglycosylase
MPLRQTIGISLALLVASAGAMAKTQETSTSHQPSQPPDAGHQRSANRTEKPRSLPRLVQARSPSRLARHRQARVRYRNAVAHRTDNRGAEPSDLNWGTTRVVGSPEIGQAAWYDLVGGRTSSGERLDTVNPTAAHRSLPLGSCAKVTDLDTGRSVIVKINDRGPYHRRFIIDLSPRAAEELGMRYAGVAAVAVEPVTVEPGATAPAAAAASPPTLAAVYRTAGTNLTQ